MDLKLLKKFWFTKHIERDILQEPSYSRLPVECRAIRFTFFFFILNVPKTINPRITHIITP